MRPAVRPLRGSTVLHGILGLAFGLAVALAVGKVSRGKGPGPGAELLERVRAQNERLETLTHEQRRAREALKLARGQVRPGVPTPQAPAAAPAAPSDPAVAAENRLRVDNARRVLETALTAGRWSDESRVRFREQLAAMSDDTVRNQVVHELIVAINSQKLKLEGQQLELF